MQDDFLLRPPSQRNLAMDVSSIAIQGALVRVSALVLNIEELGNPFSHIWRWRP
jgi:hypothetical protein